LNRAIITAVVGLLSLALATAFAQAPPREAQADLPGVRLSYSDTGGNGVAVVFVHAAIRQPPRVGSTRFPRSRRRAIA
jgi:hypothetical protein